MALGIELTETLSGSYYAIASPGDEHPMSVSVRVSVRDFAKLLLQPTAEISGEVVAEGLADHRAIRGTLQLDPIVRQKLIYDFTFTNDAGQECRFHGEKDLEATRPIATITTLPGSILVEDREHARAVLRWEVREELVRFVKSLRLKL